MKNQKNQIAVLYSVSQEVFHIESLSDYIAKNMRDIYSSNYNDYKLIGVFNDYREADKFIDRFEKWINGTISLLN
jgi:hypothetical protein